MRVVVITPPQPVVTVEETKLHARIDDGIEDTLVARLIATATRSIDGPDRWPGVAIGEQTLEFRLNSFACTEIMLPCPPIIGIVSVMYLDQVGVDQTLTTEDYRLFNRSIAPSWGKSWPSARRDHEAVRIRYKAGFTTVPEDVRGGIIAAVADMYENRETTLTEAGERALEFAVQGIRTFA